MAAPREPFVPEGYYHLYSHAVGRENLFRTSENYRYFLTRYAAYVPPVAETFAYCLMPNHIHFLIQVRPANTLCSFFRDASKPQKHAAADPADLNRAVAHQLGTWLNAYSKAYNRRYGRRGRLFVEGIHRKRVTNERYLYKLVHYIHCNPVHHGFVEDLAQWPYSSYQALLKHAPAFLAQEQVVAWFGGWKAYQQIHEQNNDVRLIEQMEYV